jgi:hypothetical protein
MVAEVNQAVKETGVRIASLVPVFGWSAPDEQERQAQVRNWKRLLEIANGLECPVVMTELSGDPNQRLKSEHAFYHSMEELIPVFERYGLQLDIEAHPYDFAVADLVVLVHPGVHAGRVDDVPVADVGPVVVAVLCWVLEEGAGRTAQVHTPGQPLPRWRRSQNVASQPQRPAGRLRRLPLTAARPAGVSVIRSAWNQFQTARQQV